MNIFVLVKQVPDTETKIRPKSDKSSVDLSSVKWIMNPYDEFAVEQALQAKAANSGSHVIAIRVGPIQSNEVLRTAMAMGADESILVELDSDEDGLDSSLDSYRIAKALKGAIEKSGKTPDLILSGKQAIDSDCLQVPQLLAQMMGLPSVSVVVGFEQKGEQFILKREGEGGALEIYTVTGPCVVACNKGLNTPRYAPLPGIIRAKKRPLARYSLADVGVSDEDRRLKYTNFRLPPGHPEGKTFEATEETKQQSVVKEVVGLLRTEAKVI